MENESEKPTVEETVKLIRRDVAQIRKNLRWRGKMLTPEIAPKIEEEFRRLNEMSPRPYRHYEIGQQLFVSTVLSNLRRKVGLKIKPRELLLIKRMLWPINYNPPARIVERGLRAAEKLAELEPARSQKIFEAYKKALSTFTQTFQTKAATKTDMFLNPVISHFQVLHFRSANSFAELATFYKRIIDGGKLNSSPYR